MFPMGASRRWWLADAGRLIEDEVIGRFGLDDSALAVRDSVCLSCHRDLRY